MLLSPRQHQILSLMGVEVWQRLGTTRHEQAETPAPDTWCGWIHQPDSAHALVICELSPAANASDGNRFNAAEQKLLRNILFAAGIALDQCNLILVQPGASDSRDLDIGDTMLTAVSGDELKSRLSHLVAETTLVFGGSLVQWLSGVMQDSLSSTACMVPFRLQEMLHQPEYKKECWNMIKPLRSRGQPAGL